MCLIRAAKVKGASHVNTNVSLEKDTLGGMYSFIYSNGTFNKSTALIFLVTLKLTSKHL